MISELIDTAHTEGRLFIRSTLKDGTSFHAWPDRSEDVLRLKQIAWDLPTTNAPGKWRQVQAKQIEPHKGGLHAAKFHAMSYWIGPEIYLCESAPYSPIVETDDVVATSKARLLQKCATNDRFWFDFACDCLDKLLEFPRLYHYDQLGEQTTEQLGKLHPSAARAFESAKNYYDFQLTYDLLRKKRKDIGTPLSATENKHFRQHSNQSSAHLYSHGRDVGFDLHNQAMTEALIAFGTAKDFFGSHFTAFDVAQNILKHCANAYEAAGREQQILMINSGYTNQHGLGTLLTNLPYIPHNHVIPGEFGRLARRGFMLAMNDVLLKQLQIETLAPQSPRHTVGDVIAQHVENLTPSR